MVLATPKRSKLHDAVQRAPLERRDKILAFYTLLIAL